MLTFTLASQDRNGNSTISFRSRARSGKFRNGRATEVTEVAAGQVGVPQMTISRFVLSAEEAPVNSSGPTHIGPLFLVAVSVVARSIVTRSAGGVSVVVRRRRSGSAAHCAQCSADQRAGCRTTAASGDPADGSSGACAEQAAADRALARIIDRYKPTRPSPIPRQMRRRKLAFSLPFLSHPHGCLRSG